MLAMIGTVLPVILIFFLGVWTRRTNFISAEAMKDIKKFILNIALPCVLLQTFMTMEIEKEYFTMVFLTFVLLFLLLVGGKVFDVIPNMKYRYNPYMCTGFSFGLVGLSLFSMIYGTQRLQYFAAMGLAHEVFVWTVYYIIFRGSEQDEKMDFSIILNVFKSPLIISVVVGICINLLGLTPMLLSNSFCAGIITTLEYIGNTATPFMLISIGYGLTLEAKYLKESAKLMAVRTVVLVVIGILFKFLVVDQFMSSSMLLDVSYVSFLLLPPLFSLPILISEKGEQEDIDIVTSAVGIYTMVSILLFIAFAFLVPIELL
ncbi:MAG: hypothetical protein ATN33_04040 [Epulopiscium sp. Nele67-Bin001]|nr:MAG: hypothetical protein BEN18_01475 [Epulopiscium sp. Nuni2H_MBin001]OON94773.1 MAG: hypothetical protein ATN33_04040 [Epulopiscium sp. Nele67-Bin001]